MRRVICRPCNTKNNSMPAYYDVKKKEIVLCSNSHVDAEAVRASTMHEMIHVFDVSI